MLQNSSTIIEEGGEQLKIRESLADPFFVSRITGKNPACPIKFRPGCPARELSRHFSTKPPEVLEIQFGENAPEQPPSMVQNRVAKVDRSLSVQGRKRT